MWLVVWIVRRIDGIGGEIVQGKFCSKCISILQVSNIYLSRNLNWACTSLLVNIYLINCEGFRKCAIDFFMVRTQLCRLDWRRNQSFTCNKQQMSWYKISLQLKQKQASGLNDLRVFLSTIITKISITSSYQVSLI